MTDRKKLILALTAIFTLNIMLIALAQAAGAATYERGSSGELVSEMQSRLKEWGYYSGEVDGIISVPSSDYARLKAENAGLQVYPSYGTVYYNINCSVEPYDDPLVRKALCLAIDRQSLIDNVVQVDAEPAYSFLAPGYMVDGVDITEGRSDYGLSATADVEAAQAALAEAGYPNGEGFPTLQLSYYQDDTVSRIVEAMAEMLKTGCTTCFDHHYVFPAGCGDLIGAQFAAAEELGMRMFASRGSMDLSRKDGGLPPDSVVQTVDEIMKDSARLIETYHDPSFGSMRQLALAPCSPFSVSAELLRQSAILARQYHVRLHTHLCETKDEENYMLAREGMRPLAFMQTLGWVGPDVWYAHGIHFNDEELKLLAETGTGVCHCPASNMKLASGIARIPDMLKLGVPVGLGVDGSASNDGSSLMEELRTAFLLHRLNSSREAPSGYDFLKIATRGSARLLGRDDIGSLSVGRCCDLFLIDSRRLELVGACYDPKAVLATVGVRGPVDYTVVNGRITVREGRLARIDEEATAREARMVCEKYLEQ